MKLSTDVSESTSSTAQNDLFWEIELFAESGEKTVFLTASCRTEAFNKALLENPNFQPRKAQALGRAY